MDECSGSGIIWAYHRVRIVVILQARLLFLCLLMLCASWSDVCTPSPTVPQHCAEPEMYSVPEKKSFLIFTQPW